MTRLFKRLLFCLFCSVAVAQPNSDIESRVRGLYERGAWAEAARLAAGAELRSAELDLYRGLALAQLGSLYDAGQVFMEGRRLYPNDPRFALELAGVAYRNHQIRIAKQQLGDALRLSPTSDYGNDFLATLFLGEGNLPAALKYWNRIDKPLIQDLSFAPMPKLRPLLRERIFAVSGGQVLTLDRLKVTEANLDRLGFFASYQFDLTPRQDQRFDLTFRSIKKAQLTGGWFGKLLPLLRGLPYRTIFVDLDNPHECPVSFSALGRWDPNKRRVSLDLSGPVRLNPRLMYLLGVDARDERWDLRTTYFGKRGGLDSLILRRVEARGELKFGLTASLQWTSGLWVTRRRFQNGDQNPYFADGWSLQLHNGLAYRLWTWPEHRVRVDTSASLRTGRVVTGAPSRFAVVEGDLAAVWLPQAKGDDLDVAFRARAARSFGTLPFDELFMLGMERDNNLWLRGYAGARDGRKGTAPLGTEYSLFQTEANRTVFKLPLVRIQLGPFFDAGRIGDPLRQFGSNGWIEATGLQAKIKTLGSFTWTLVYGRNLSNGRGVWYTTVSK